MMKVRLLIEYDGAQFSGWQYQENAHTVQAELERALEIFLRSAAKKKGEELAASPALSASGRTDSGVHARGQVATFLWPEILEFDRKAFLSAINGISGPGVSVLQAEPCADSFDPRRSPHVKCYCYRMLLRDQKDALWRDRSWRVPPDIDIRPMLAAARLLAGTHDFRAFRAADCAARTSVRTVLLSELSRPSAEELLYVVQGKGFLKQMVRIIVGTLVGIGTGRLSPDTVERMLEQGERTLGGDTAPGRGLTLEWVRYNEGDGHFGRLGG